MTVSAEEKKKTETAVFAGGCFWCMEPPYDALDGVISTTSGYTGGSKKDADYRKVSAGGTGHFEALEVKYDPSKVSYAELLEVFWHNIDPLDGRGQFCDKGSQYLSAIFPSNDEERALAEASKAAVAPAGGGTDAIKTQILAASAFYPAEDYHQDYYQKNPVRYKFYRWNCGRDQRLKQLWGDDAGGH
ncbi:MAG: peptide-methionine (S)-S-oxide reductase MsrA [Acidobacteria bacterium]|nr:peptide-methionine (S)-S-oxide reductase MsrA [Acidobacteriota bacterium]MDA1235793.1 peptide-methionine (S)-S-oxide reductase MsrA [Acidobacteriota bacterium]